MIPVNSAIGFREQTCDPAHNFIRVCFQRAVAIVPVERWKQVRLPELNGNALPPQVAQRISHLLSACYRNGNNGYPRMMDKEGDAGLPGLQALRLAAGAFRSHRKHLPGFECLDRFTEGVAIDFPALNEDTPNGADDGAEEPVVLVSFRRPADDVLIPHDTEDQGGVEVAEMVGCENVRAVLGEVFLPCDGAPGQQQKKQVEKPTEKATCHEICLGVLSACAPVI